VAHDARLAAAANGDRDAMEVVLLALLPRARNLVRYLVRGDDIDDITQEALIAVARSLPGYRGEGKLEAWADRIVARVTFAALRERSAERARAGEDLSRVDRPCEAPLPDEVYAARRRTVELLDGLSYDLRHAIVLHHVLEMSVPEIAAQLRIPVETVRSRLRLGMAKLRELAASDALFIKRASVNEMEGA
jgi:RNA polymerase sigma-70 factor (ECF subfamily)